MKNGMPARINENWGIMEHGEKIDNLWKNPVFIVGAAIHIALAVLIFLILLFLAMYLWEKVKGERYINRKQSRTK